MAGSHNGMFGFYCVCVPQGKVGEKRQLDKLRSTRAATRSIELVRHPQ